MGLEVAGGGGTGVGWPQREGVGRNLAMAEAITPVSHQLHRLIQKAIDRQVLQTLQGTEDFLELKLADFSQN